MSSTPIEKKKVTLVAKDVDWMCRELFNRVCRSSTGSRGEILSRLMRDFANEWYGEENIPEIEQQIIDKLELRKE